MSKRDWLEVTREERFFTSFLFHDMLRDPRPFWRILHTRIGCSDDVTVVDIGYEVCFFRDAFHSGLIAKRQRELEKQTFDLVLWLSNQALVIIEAKAQQGFHNKQLKKLHDARDIMLSLSTPRCPMKTIYLVGLCSSKYGLGQATQQKFDGLIRWAEIANAYVVNKCIYHRADGLYGK